MSFRPNPYFVGGVYHWRIPGPVLHQGYFLLSDIVQMTYGETHLAYFAAGVVPRAYEHAISRDFAPLTYESRAGQAFPTARGFDS